MQPFTKLLKPSNSTNKQVHWDETLQKLFEHSKNVICDVATKGFKYFNTEKRVCVMTDWSKNGIGFVLLQQACDCCSITPKCCEVEWQLVFCSSRSLTTCEKNYAPIEGELLAVTWCFRKARLFLHGCPEFTLHMDHKLLIPILSDKALS